MEVVEAMVAQGAMAARVEVAVQEVLLLNSYSVSFPFHSLTLPSLILPFILYIIPSGSFSHYSFPSSTQ